MNKGVLISVAVLLVASKLLVAADAPPKPSSHTERTLEGWTVQIDDRLLVKDGDGAKLGERAVNLLELRLKEVKLLVPADKVERLQKFTIWLDLTHGELKSPQYHPSAGWLKEHGYSEKLARCIHIPDAEYFVVPRFQREQPLGVLHELAHAYHDQVLDFDHAEIKAAWKKFVEKGDYASVLHANGKQRPHYAITDQKEFFAEMTESYFGANDFYPFNAAELQRAEPEVFSLLATIWGPLP